MLMKLDNAGTGFADLVWCAWYVSITQLLCRNLCLTLTGWTLEVSRSGLN